MHKIKITLFNDDKIVQRMKLRKDDIIGYKFKHDTLIIFCNVFNIPGMMFDDRMNDDSIELLDKLLENMLDTSTDTEIEFYSKSRQSDIGRNSDNYHVYAVIIDEKQIII